MTAPIWGLLPPEILSAMLSTGPGDGSMLAAAGAWTALGTEYEIAARDLGANLVSVSAGTWSGPTAAAYLVAHQPFLGWLDRSAARAADTARRVTDAATAYTAALAEMPTLGEIAANHATHAILVGTNFLGLNTIPIAINEADYSRMWVQAATVMTNYESVASAVLASIPPPEQPPAILGSRIANFDQLASPPVSAPSALDDVEARLAMLLENLLGPLRELFDGSGQWMDWLRRLAAALAPLLSAVSSVYLTIQFFTTLTINILLWSTPLLALILPLAFQLALAPAAPQPEPGPLEVAAPAADPVRAPVRAAAPVSPWQLTSTPTSSAAPGTTAATVSNAPSTPPAAPTPMFYAIVSPASPPRQPPSATERPHRSDDAQASSPVTASAPAAARASAPARRRRRRTVTRPGERYEYADMAPADATASSGTMADSTGSGSSPTRRPRGLGNVEHSDDPFSVPARPLLPSDWDS